MTGLHWARTTCWVGLVQRLTVGFAKPLPFKISFGHHVHVLRPEQACVL